MWRALFSDSVTIFDVEREVRQIVVSLSVGVGTLISSTPQMDDLAREIERLHGQLRSSLELLRTDIRDSKDFVSTDLDGL